MSWRIKFIPKEVDSITVSIDGVHALDWSSAEGEVFKPVPAQWAQKPSIFVRGDGHPNGRNAHMQVWWSDTMRQNMEFDNGEDHTVTRG